MFDDLFAKLKSIVSKSKPDIQIAMLLKDFAYVEKQLAESGVSVLDLYCDPYRINDNLYMMFDGENICVIDLPYCGHFVRHNACRTAAIIDCHKHLKQFVEHTVEVISKKNNINISADCKQADCKQADCKQADCKQADTLKDFIKAEKELGEFCSNGPAYAVDKQVCMLFKDKQLKLRRTSGSVGHKHYLDVDVEMLQAARPYLTKYIELLKPKLTREMCMEIVQQFPCYSYHDMVRRLKDYYRVDTTADAIEKLVTAIRIPWKDSTRETNEIVYVYSKSRDFKVSCSRENKDGVIKATVICCNLSKYATFCDAAGIMPCGTGCTTEERLLAALEKY